MTSDSIPDGEPPRRVQLTKDDILATALRLADERGLVAVSIRRIADELDLSPMSLYRHIRTKQEITQGLADLAWQILGEPPEGDVPWDEHLRQTFSQMHRALLDHPGFVDVLLLGPTSGLQVYAVIERLIGVLVDAGFDSEFALLAVAALESYTLGFTMQQRVRVGRDAAAVHGAMFDLPPEDFPHLSGAPERFAGWAAEDRFDAGLAWTIDQMRRGLDPAS